jgi:hypothetical protein
MDVILDWADKNISKPNRIACAANGGGNGQGLGGGTGAPGNGKGQAQPITTRMVNFRLSYI